MQIQFNFIYLLKLYDWILINDPRSYYKNQCKY